MADDTTAFRRWAQAWLELAAYHGPDVPDIDGRIDGLISLWTQPIPAEWERTTDHSLLNRDRRYRRSDLQTVKPGTEHELELQVLGPDPSLEETACFGDTLIDGINAVPLARDTHGGRQGNVEADMLLLTEGDRGRKQLLVEVKTTANNAWYATVESLRQLKLFTNSPSAQTIFTGRHSHSGGQLPVESTVLAPPTFYSAPGTKQRAIAPTRQLVMSLAGALGVSVHLATWNEAQRIVADLP